MWTGAGTVCSTITVVSLARCEALFEPDGAPGALRVASSDGHLDSGTLVSVHGDGFEPDATV